jgi:hypothetical protein
LLLPEIPIPNASLKTIVEGRKDTIETIIDRTDRLLVFCDPCSIHDPATALEYVSRLKKLIDKHSDDLYIIMRAYFEKPRTTVGWKGLINDPDIDESFKINKGLRSSSRSQNLEKMREMYGIDSQEEGDVAAMRDPRIRKYTPLSMPHFSLSRYSESVSTPVPTIPCTPQFHKSKHANPIHHSPPIPSPATQIPHT